MRCRRGLQDRRGFRDREGIPGLVVVQRLREDDPDDLTGAGQQWPAAVSRLDPSQQRVDLAGDARLSVDVLSGRVENLSDPRGVQA